ncbi:hypothetical protein [Leuconostoc falkenbergense]|uniref:hypothetical protein n=1 Tax=Leuconostoc falkenbergense TaxID=2766470 RepID=UPI0019673525|nr:hypothetical protein [Leuconostoc falkenbergense]
MLIRILEFMNQNAGVADWLASIATLLATGSALYLGLRKSNSIHFEIQKGFYLSFWSPQKSINPFNKISGTVSLLNVYVTNGGITPKVFSEVGVIVKGNFRKQTVSSYKLVLVNSGETKLIDFGNNPSGSGHEITMDSIVANPFLTVHVLRFRVYLKDTGGKIYKSKYFRLSKTSQA